MQDLHDLDSNSSNFTHGKRVRLMNAAIQVIEIVMVSTRRERGKQEENFVRDEKILW